MGSEDVHVGSKDLHVGLPVALTPAMCIAGSMWVYLLIVLTLVIWVARSIGWVAGSACDLQHLHVSVSAAASRLL